MPTTTLDSTLTQSVFERLHAANGEFSRLYPGDNEKRQPVHTVYGGAHLFKSDTIPKLGQLALRALEEYAPNADTLAEALGIANRSLMGTVYERVVAKLKREAVEDFRIDFEDGFGNRPDAEEDEVAERAAREVVKGMQAGTLSPYIGIRIKPFTEELKARSVRTLDIFLSTLLVESNGRLPENFVVTLPKVTIPEQVMALVELFQHLESRHNLAPGSLKLEVMVETTQSIIHWNGHCALPEIVSAGRGRCVAAHFGTYDYTASCSITAAYQLMDHPACDFARSFMKVSLGGTGVWLSDGATNVMPVGPHRAMDGQPLTPAQLKENREAVFAAWKLDYEHIRHSLKNGFYQGWDLHPAQFPIRFAACYLFFLEGFEEASGRLRNFMDKFAQATLLGSVFDDAATGQGLLNYFLRALNCGAVTEAEVLATGLTLEEVRGRSFAKIMDNRRKASEPQAV